MTKGNVVISLDFECAWGVIDDGLWQQKQSQNVYTELRPKLKAFVELLGQLEIPCTWAAVGAMIDDPEHRDLSYLNGKFGIAARHFLKNANDQSFDGRDLLDIVLSCETPQKFGTHTYSHLLFSDAEQSAEVVLEDIKKAKEANKRRGIASDVLVFPRNQHGYFEQLVSSGIKKVRMPATGGPDPYSVEPAVQRFFRAMLKTPTTISENTIDCGLQLHHASELLNWGANPSKLKISVTKRRIMKSIQLAQKGHHIHLWLHPFDLVEAPGLYNFVEKVLYAIAESRSNNELTVIPF